MNRKFLAHDVFWGVVAAGLALLLRWALDPILGGKYPYATAFVIITLTAWHAGPRAATIMLVLCFPAASYFFVEPRGEFTFNFSEDGAGFLINGISAAVIICLGAYAKRATDALALANRELVTANQSLAEMSERKDHFLTTLSHELRNPMSAIVMAAQMLKNSTPPDESSAHAVDILERQSGQMKGLLDDLLDKRRIALGKFELKRTMVDVRDCISAGIESHRPSLNLKKQKLNVAVPQTPVTAAVDARRVTQMVANLVGNAAKHTNELTEIDVWLTERDGEIVIAVRDNGHGIPPDVLPHLFEPFNPKRRSSHSGGDGLGIGLTLTKGLVDMHGGTITVTSADTGSEFTISLPRKRM